MNQIAVMTPDQLQSFVRDAVRAELGALVRDMSKPQNSYTIQEAADFLGYSVHALNKWRKDGRGPAFRKGDKGVRYERSDLEAFKQSERILTTDSPDAHF